MTKNSNGGGYTDLIIHAISESTVYEDTEIKKTMDEIANDSEDGLFQDSVLQSVFDDDNHEAVSKLPDFDKTMIDLQSGYYWALSDGKTSKTENAQSLYNETLWDVSIYSGKTVEIVCDAIGTVSGRRSGICDAEGNITTQIAESEFQLGTDGKYHASFTVTEDYLFVSFAASPAKQEINIHISGETKDIDLADQAETVDSDAEQKNIINVDSVPVEEFGTTLRESIWWSDLITYGAPDFNKSLSNLDRERRKSRKSESRSILI